LDIRDINIILCDINGKILIHQKENTANGVINLKIDTSRISGGVYYLRVNNCGGNFQIVKKLVKL